MSETSVDFLRMDLASQHQQNSQIPGDVEISVVIGTHEAGSELEETLASIANQEDAPLWECLIVGNGHFQADAALHHRLANDPRFRLLHSQPPGLTEALRQGCAQALGRWIARIDVGDVMEPSRLHRQAEGLKRFPECVLCTSAVQICGPSWEPIWIDRADGPVNAPVRAMQTPAAQGLAVAIPHHASVMFNRQAYIKAGEYRTQFYFGQDWDLWYRLAHQGSFLILEEVLTSMRLRTRGISSLHRPEQVAIARLSLACHIARCEGREEDDLLQEAATIRPSRSKQKRVLFWRTREAEGLYFIAENLRRIGDPRCRIYFLRALRKGFWIPRLWLRSLQSLGLKTHR
jgi:glycosyltransferase involved in cell wall biosynthesis